MLSILARPQTSGSEVRRLIDGLADALESEPVAVDGGWRFDWDDGSTDPQDAIEQMTWSLDRLSATWPIHLRLAPDPMFHGS